MNAANDHVRSVLTLRMATSERGAAIGRRSLIVTTAGGLAALIGSKPADAEMLKAACTTIDCPAPKTESLDLVDNMVKPSEYTGKGATFKRPSDDSFKRVASRPFSPPSSQLFRSKKDPSTAIFFDVEKIDNNVGGWKPTLKEKYAETFKEDFTLVGETGPISERGIDKYTIEYKVKTELEGKFQVMHYVSSFAAAKDQVYIVNAQAKDEKWGTVGSTLRTCAESLKPNQ